MHFDVTTPKGLKIIPNDEKKNNREKSKNWKIGEWKKKATIPRK